MGAKLVDLLKYKKEVPIIVDGETLSTVWLRVVGDTDLQEAYRLGRLASADRRRALRDITSETYRDELGPIDEATIEDCKILVVQSKRRGFDSLAIANVERPELPEISEFAQDPDAPTLEEQEKMDKQIFDDVQEYDKNRKEYIETKVKELETELSVLSEESIRALARIETTDVLALTSFLVEVQDQKICRAVFKDKLCKELEFSSIKEFRDTHETIKSILYQEYSKLELNGDDVKN